MVYLDWLEQPAECVTTTCLLGRTVHMGLQKRCGEDDLASAAESVRRSPNGKVWPPQFPEVGPFPAASGQVLSSLLLFDRATIVRLPLGSTHRIFSKSRLESSENGIHYIRGHAYLGRSRYTFDRHAACRPCNLR